jgi:hypothetical protein
MTRWRHDRGAVRRGQGHGGQGGFACVCRVWSGDAGSSAWARRRKGLAAGGRLSIPVVIRHLRSIAGGFRLFDSLVRGEGVVLGCLVSGASG